jgi:hypothetical protein
LALPFDAKAASRHEIVSFVVAVAHASVAFAEGFLVAWKLLFSAKSNVDE